MCMLDTSFPTGILIPVVPSRFLRLVFYVSVFLFLFSLFLSVLADGLELSTSGFHVLPRTTCTNERATMLKYMALL